MKNIIYAAAEGLPFIKSGGLADVIGSLPYSLDENQYNISVVLPMYKKIIENNADLKKITSFKVISGIINRNADVYTTKVKNITFYFIREDSYFYRDGMYGYADDGERFAFFDKAILELIENLQLDIDIIHCHDWHTGMVAPMAKREYKDARIGKIKHIFTIHNLAFQGNFPKETLRCFNLSDGLYKDGSIRFDDGISFMKAAIKYADKVTTVSNNYAREILTQQYGERMENVLREREHDLWGIVNGIDTDNWNPETDKLIKANFSSKSLTGKKKCKRDLQEKLGLRVDDNVLLIGIVSRITWQKGASLILEKLGEIMNQDVQLIIFGNGDSFIENQLKPIEQIYPHRAVFYCGFDENLSHSVYAGLDLFLMPSLFEPCGISQLLAMRYGALPLVREVGGLKDTVSPYNEYDSTGWGFSFANFSGDDMMFILRYAINTYYYNKKDWKMLMVNAMNRDVSWQNSAKLYDQLYKSVL